ncbi:protein-tyrosine phosphatase family protein [Paenibacillus abyssi]|uniref:Tyrosine specific protein phosphatases domain-containing protein n=1 Tax=Paenibacillus abyssi TaxID=1340531 RepID=A0A917FRU0_9BACL|nr:dual specificity protein phosphatase family protein [Paenibacillus abyssi]GGF96935.1 hypothetical protein GCM10010916_12760 [Paenibacillus abyssi]
MPELKQMKKSYQQLIENKVWIGGLCDVSALVEKECCDVIIDLRGEKELTGKEHPQHYLHFPLMDGQDNQEPVIHEAVETVAKLVERGHKVALHCTAGQSRTACVASGALIRLGLAESVLEAQQKVQTIRPEAQIHPKLISSLSNLYS